MKILTKYLKFYLSSLIICFLLLFLQAICDLNLPNLMSDIVNIGIQKSGIEDSLLTAISENSYLLISELIPKDEKNIFQTNYEQIVSDPSSSNYQKYIETYPLLSEQNIYLLKESSPNKIKGQEYFSRACVAFMEISQTLAERYGNNIETAPLSQNSEPSLKIISFLRSISEEDYNKIWEYTATIDESTLSQTSLAFTKQCYTELKIDLNTIQMRYIFKIGLYMLLITLIGAIATIIVSFLSSRISSGIAKKLRKDLFQKVQNFSNMEFDLF